jgi:hypothetical protein
MRGKANATLVLEEAILEIVEERAPITVRGVCYPLFSIHHLIPDMSVDSAKKISRIMTEMREAGTLDWTRIVDAGRAVERAGTWGDPSAIIRAAVKTYRRDNWQDQRTIVEVWSEKGTVQGVLAPVLDELGVTFRVMKGFGSFTSVMQAAEDSAVLAKHQRTVALYLGDWDPSGLYMSERDLPKRLERYGSWWQLRRIALVQEDTRQLPSFDVASKSKDARHRWFVESFGQQCWELDAMNPNDLRARVRNEIESYIDWTLWNRAIEVEAAEVESMHDFHKAWQSRLIGRP